MNDDSPRRERRTESSDRSPQTIEAIKAGDFVSVHFLPNLDGLVGFVVKDTPTRMRLSVHQQDADHLTDDCLGWDTVVPWSAVAFVRHLPGKPKRCLCREALS